jgi:hypothetical protein
MKGFPLIEPVTVGLGIALILMYSFDRFNTPPSNRALTTAARYYTSASVYMLIYLLAYSILLYYPDLMNWLLKMASENLTIPDSLPTAVVGAILLSIVIPKLPGFAKIDSRVRKFLQTLAAIPLQAYNLSGDIKKAKYSIPEKWTEKVTKTMREIGFKRRDLVFEDTDTAEFLWTKITALYLQIKAWEEDDRFLAFFKERNDQFKRLEDRYKRLRFMALNCFSLSKQIAGDEREDNMIKSVKQVNSNFRDQADDLLKEICNFISQGTLKCQLTRASRSRELKNMGFIMPVDSTSSSLIVQNVAIVSIILIVLLLMNFIIIAPDTWPGREQTLLMVTMIVSIYALSVYCAIYAKEKFASFKRKKDGKPLADRYILTGVAAVCLGIIVNLIFKTLIYVRGPADLFSAIGEAWSDFSKYSYPWMLMAFVTASTTSFLADYGSPEKISDRLWRLLQATIQAVLTAMAGFLILWWLRDIYPETRKVPERIAVLSVSLAVGFIIGYIIPHWYRGVHAKESELSEEKFELEDSNLSPSTTWT